MSLLATLEEISRTRPDRVLRLRGHLAPAGEEPFELLVYRGFSSSVTHPTAFDPDCPALPQGASIESAELLAAPLDPANEQRLAGPLSPEAFLVPEAW